jgi:hypothetical protein
VIINDSSIGSLLDIGTLKVAGEGLSTGPASGEERMGFVWLPSADFGRGTCAKGGMSNGPELY